MVRFSLPLTTFFGFFRPDGRALAWWQPIGRAITREPIRVRYLDDVGLRPLLGTEGDYSAFWSSDGGAIAYFATNQLKVIRLSDGEIRVLADAPEPEGGTWQGTLTQGQIVFASAGKLHVLELASAQVRTLPLPFPPGERPMGPVFLPEGDRFFYLSAPARDRVFRLFRSSLQGEASLELQQAAGRVHFAQHLRTGAWHLLYPERQGEVFSAFVAQPVSARTGQVQGKPARLLSGMVGPVNTIEKSAFFAPRGGGAVYQRRVSAVPVWRPVWHDRAGRPISGIGTEDAMRGLAISPDGQRLMLLMGRSQGEIRVMRIDGSGSRTLAAGRLLDPHWSSDGKCIYYIAEPAQARALVRHDLNGSVPPETVLQFKPGEVVRLAGISPDGRTALLFLGSRLHALGLDQSPVRAPEPLVLQDKSLHPWNHAIFSPDGKWIASPMSAGGMVFIPWPQSGTPLRAYGATTSLTFPFFHPSGKELCGHQEGILACSPIRFTADGPRLDEPQIIPAEARAFTSGYHDSQWAPDGSKILMLTTDQPERVLPTVLTDWSVLAENREN